MKRIPFVNPAVSASVLGLMLCVTACSSPSSVTDVAAEEPAAFTESAQPNPRLVLTYDGGVLVLDASSLEQIADFELDGFLRVSPAGDDRHVLITDPQGFRVVDTGAYTDVHGDHGHSYVGDPRLGEVAFPAVEPGHVVPHGDVTTLFADGTGEITFFDPADLANGQPKLEHLQLPDAHHGVAVTLLDGTVLTTRGTHDSRSTIVAFDDSGEEFAAIDGCPGVHGEAMAAGEVAVFGCQDGVVVYRDGTFSKVESPDAYGRIGNQRGSDVSTIVLGDYKSDPDADLERPTRVSLIDTESLGLRLVELGTSYTFRSLARGPAGEALVLGTDGTLRVIDPIAGAVTASVPVVEAWIEPDEWQQPRPTIAVLGTLAFITEPATSSIHVVDLEALEIVDSVGLDVTPNELALVAG